MQEKFLDDETLGESIWVQEEFLGEESLGEKKSGCARRVSG